MYFITCRCTCNYENEGQADLASHDLKVWYPICPVQHDETFDQQLVCVHHVITMPLAFFQHIFRLAISMLSDKTKAV